MWWKREFLVSRGVAILLAIFLLCPATVEARSGCCSWHGGVCGCGCCDGTSLSATCAPYYSWCYAPAPVVKSVATPIYKYEWVSQSGTISADGLAHEYAGLAAGQTLNLSLSMINRSGTTIKGKTALGAVPAGKQVQVGAWGIGTQNPQDGTPSFLDSSSFVLNNNRFVYYDGADVPNGGTITFNWTAKLSTTVTNGVYNLYVLPVSEYSAWTRQVKNGYTLPSCNSDIFWRLTVR